MRKEYDFSKGERGKFYRPDAKLNMPIYLDEEVIAFIEDIANKKGTDFYTGYADGKAEMASLGVKIKE